MEHLRGQSWKLVDVGHSFTFLYTEDVVTNLAVVQQEILPFSPVVLSVYTLVALYHQFVKFAFTYYPYLPQMLLQKY